MSRIDVIAYLNTMHVSAVNLISTDDNNDYLPQYKRVSVLFLTRHGDFLSAAANHRLGTHVSLADDRYSFPHPFIVMSDLSNVQL